MVYTELDSPLGTLTLAGDEDGLAGLWLSGQQYFAPGGLPGERRDDLPVFIKTREWLDAYFAGHNPAPGALPLNPAGTAFRRRVWDLLLTIPYGETRGYGELARMLNAQPGSPGTSARAVGGAVGHNPLSIIIPCHRVVGASGSLTGYAGGLERKVWLLKHEGVLL